MGPQGAAGPSGSAGANHSTYTKAVTVAASTWNVTHSLARFPSITPVDDSGVVITTATITYVDNNNATVVHSSAKTGKVYCN